MDIAREEDLRKEALSMGANVEKENGQVHPGKDESMFGLAMFPV